MLDVQELSKDGCLGLLQSGQVFVGPVPTINATATMQPTCSVSTGCIEFYGLPAGNWIINPGTIMGSTSIITLSGLVQGTYDYSVSNAGGCSYSIIRVMINEAPEIVEAIAGPDRTICIKTSTQSGKTAAITYSWTSVPAGFISTLANPIVCPLVTTTYTAVKTITATGCTSTSIVVIKVKGSADLAINCPPPVTVLLNDGCTATGVNLGTPVTSGNCGVLSVTNDAPATFLLGVTTVTWTVTDDSKNTTTSTLTVTVTGTGPKAGIHLR